MPFPIARQKISFIANDYLSVARSIFEKPGCTDLTTQFEKQFAQYLDEKHCFGFSSGSAALYHGLLCCGLKPEDMIIVPSYEFTSVVETIRLLGFIPVFARIENGGVNVTFDTIREAYEQGVQAVLIAHIFGCPIDMDEIQKWADSKGLILIEDCAHSTGAPIKKKRPGFPGAFSFYSFGDGKPLSTCGGGAVATSDDELAGKLKDAQAKLRIPSYSFEAKRLLKGLFKAIFSSRFGFSIGLFPFAWLLSFTIGRNPIDRFFHRGRKAFSFAPDDYEYRFTDASARLGLSQLENLDKRNQLRRSNGLALLEELEQVRQVLPLSSGKSDRNIFLNFVVQTTKSEPLSLFLLQKGIDTRKDYLLRYSESEPGGTAPEETLILPNHAGLSKKDMKWIGRKVKEYFLSEKAL